MARESSDVRFDFGPLLQGQTRIANLKGAYNLLIIGPSDLQSKANLWVITSREFFDVVRIDLGPLLQCQTRVASSKNWLVIGPRVLGCEPDL